MVESVRQTRLKGVQVRGEEGRVRGQAGRTARVGPEQLAREKPIEAPPKLVNVDADVDARHPALLLLLAKPLTTLHKEQMHARPGTDRDRLAAAGGRAVDGAIEELRAVHVDDAQMVSMRVVGTG